jgi:DNA-binding transcriptional LysR family regulator
MKSLDPLSGVSAFIAVSETLNFGSAAEQLGLARATISAQIAELEKRLGVRLFQRSTRHVRLTEAGLAYRTALGGVMGQVTQASQLAQSYQTEAVGKIRVSAPEELCERYIVPAMAEFLADQPGLAMELDLTSRRVDVIKEGFDLAIRASLFVDPNLIVRRLGTARVTLTASPDYVARRGAPKTIEEIHEHDIIHHTGLKAGALWVMRRGEEERRVPVATHVQANVGSVLRESAIAGLGITYLPEFITGDAIRAGKLVRVLPEWRIQSVDVNAVYPSNRNITPKVRGFVSVLAKRFEGMPDFPE